MVKKYVSSGFEIKWNIDSFSVVEDLPGMDLESPIEVDSGLSKTKWYLSLFLSGKVDPYYIAIYLTKHEDSVDVQIPVNFSIGFYAGDICLVEPRVSFFSVFKNNITFGFDRFLLLTSFFGIQEAIRENNDTLSVHCKIEEVEVDVDFEFGLMSDLERMRFNWSINDWHNYEHNRLEVDVHGEIKAVIRLDLCRKEIVGTDEECILFNLTKVTPEWDGLFMCRIIATDKLGCETHVQEFRHCFRDESDTLSDFLFPGNIPYSCVRDGNLVLKVIFNIAESLNPRYTSIEDQKEIDIFLKEYFKCLYQFGILCDVEARSGNDIVSCHHNVIRKKSIVIRKKPFKKEKIYKYIFDFDDVDGDTLQRMIDFMYFDELKVLDYASSVKLFAAGHAYEMQDLKQKMV